MLKNVLGCIFLLVFERFPSVVRSVVYSLYQAASILVCYILKKSPYVKSIFIGNFRQNINAFFSWLLELAASLQSFIFQLYNKILYLGSEYLPYTFKSIIKGLDFLAYVCSKLICQVIQVVQHVFIRGFYGFTYLVPVVIDNFVLIAIWTIKYPYDATLGWYFNLINKEICERYLTTIFVENLLDDKLIRKEHYLKFFEGLNISKEYDSRVGHNMFLIVMSFLSVLLIISNLIRLIWYGLSCIWSKERVFSPCIQSNIFKIIAFYILLILPFKSSSFFTILRDLLCKTYSYYNLSWWIHIEEDLFVRLVLLFYFLRLIFKIVGKFFSFPKITIFFKGLKTVLGVTKIALLSVFFLLYGSNLVLSICNLNLMVGSLLVLFLIISIFNQYHKKRKKNKHFTAIVVSVAQKTNSCFFSYAALLFYSFFVFFFFVLLSIDIFRFSETRKKLFVFIELGVRNVFSQQQEFYPVLARFAFLAGFVLFCLNSNNCMKPKLIPEDNKKEVFGVETTALASSEDLEAFVTQHEAIELDIQLPTLEDCRKEVDQNSEEESIDKVLSIDDKRDVLFIEDEKMSKDQITNDENNDDLIKSIAEFLTVNDENIFEVSMADEKVENEPVTVSYNLEEVLLLDASDSISSEVNETLHIEIENKESTAVINADSECVNNTDISGFEDRSGASINQERNEEISFVRDNSISLENSLVVSVNDLDSVSSKSTDCNQSESIVPDDMKTSNLEDFSDGYLQSNRLFEKETSFDLELPDMGLPSTSSTLISKRSLETEEGQHSSEFQDLERRNRALVMALKKSRLLSFKFQYEIELNKLMMEELQEKKDQSGSSQAKK